MKKAVLKLEYKPTDCMSCLLSCYKKFDNGQEGLFCAAMVMRTKVNSSEIHKDCPLEEIEE